MIMSYKNSWNIDNDGNVYQTESPEQANIYPVPAVFKFHFLTTEEQSTFDDSYAFNVAIGDVPIIARLEKVKKTNIMIPENTINNNFVHGAAPRFSQVWRQ